MKEHNLKKIIFILLFLIVNLFSAPYKEYEVKAAIIGKFPLFIKWPNDSLKKTKYFKLCVLGDGEIVSFFKKMFKGKTIKNLPVEIKIFSEIEQNIKSCNILFIKKINRKQAKEICRLLKRAPVLSISDDESLVYKGIQIGFYLQNNRVQFKINYRAIKESGLSVSYLLLNAGEVVEQ